MKNRMVFALLSMLMGWSMTGMGQAASPPPVVSFLATDDPGSWFKCANTGTSASGIGCVPASIVGSGQKSLAVIRPHESVAFPSLGGRTRTVHTATSLIYPTSAEGMPVILDVNLHLPNVTYSETDPEHDQTVTLHTPGLYVFTCSIHPYMFGAVIVDPEEPDKKSLVLDLGESITIANSAVNIGSIYNSRFAAVPTSSDLATRLLRTFFIATDPTNWQNYASKTPWHITYPPVPVRITGGAVDNLRDVLNARYGNDIKLEKLSNPVTPGVGQVWVDTQFEKVFQKNKPGTATAVNAETWKVDRKVALPQINMNNPHNMWTDRNQTLIYQTQWFDNMLAVFNRQTGALVRNLTVGDAPAHVMTRVDTDQIHVTNNGENRPDSVVEIAPLGTEVAGRIYIGPSDSKEGNPHAHWMSYDGQKMVTPNVLTGNTSQVDLGTGAGTDSIDSILPVSSPLTHPLATGMMPDATKYYVANLLDSTITVIDMKLPPKVVKTIDLVANYNPVSGEISGPVGALPIQTPVSPDGKNMVTANTLTGTITVVDTRPGKSTTDTLVAMLGCDPGCHGVQYGAKKGGGYYAYVSSKFSNRMLVVDPDPNGDGNPADAKVVGTILLMASSKTAKDGTITSYPGMGGQGVLPIPLVYNGWVQKWVQECTTNDCNTWKGKLTDNQKSPGPRPLQ